MNKYLSWHHLEDSWCQEFLPMVFMKIPYIFPSVKGAPQFSRSAAMSPWSRSGEITMVSPYWKFSTLRFPWFQSPQMVGIWCWFCWWFNLGTFVERKKHINKTNPRFIGPFNIVEHPTTKEYTRGQMNGGNHLQPWVPWKERKSWSEPKLHEDMEPSRKNLQGRMDPNSDVGFAQFYPKRCLFGASTFVFFLLPKSRLLNAQKTSLDLVECHMLQ